MISIKKEPEEYIKIFSVYEHCYFCNEETDTWNYKTNQPVCKKCSKKYDLKELPKAHSDYNPKKTPQKAKDFIDLYKIMKI